MRRSVLLVASVGLAVLLVSGAALAQEGPLPDLVVEKTGPETATLNDSGYVDVRHDITLTNIGDAPAVAAGYGTIVLRDEVKVEGKFINLTAGDGGGQRIGGISGTLPYGPPWEKRPFNVHAPWVIFWASYNPYTPVVINPGGYSIQRMVVTMISGGRIKNCATADPDNLIAESNESNNTDCLTTRVTG